MPPYAGATEITNDDSFETIPLEATNKIVDRPVMADEEDSVATESLNLNPLDQVKGEFFDNLQPCLLRSTTGEWSKPDFWQNNTNTPTTLCTIEEPEATKMDKVLDIDLCKAIGNPKSALFKNRICAETGQNVHKYHKGGYTKEEKVGEDGEITKIYYSKLGLQRKQDRQKHKESGYSSVMDELVEHFAAQERAQEKAREEEEAKIAHQKELEAQYAVVRATQKAAEAAQALEDAKLSNKAKKVLKTTWKKTKKPFSKKVANSDKGTWKATIDSVSGNTYYFHTKTREATWIKPTGFKEQ